MNFILTLVIINAFIFIIVNFIIYKGKKSKKRLVEYTDFGDYIPINFTISIVFMFVWPNVIEASYTLFDVEHPVCIDYIATLDINSHWMNPKDSYVEIPSNIKSFKLISRIHKDATTTHKIKPGQKWSVSHSSIINENDAENKSRVHLYIFRYKKFGPFQAPNYIRRGFFSYDTPEIYHQAKCVETVQLTNLKNK